MNIEHFISSSFIKCSVSLSIFLHTEGTKNFTHKRGDKQFYTDSSGNNNVCGEKEEDVSKANILESEASKLSAGARILWGP